MSSIIYKQYGELYDRDPGHGSIKTSKNNKMPQQLNLPNRRACMTWAVIYTLPEIFLKKDKKSPVSCTEVALKNATI
uniref:Uncharacterized protein n=1 Tax=Rhizophora mucronata TaxID=61149 RepID=A0A2P2PIB4_RHIMU